MKILKSESKTLSRNNKKIRRGKIKHAEQIWQTPNGNNSKVWQDIQKQVDEKS